jgi:hypothetical protein
LTALAGTKTGKILEVVFGGLKVGDFDGNTLYNHGREFGLLVEIGKNIALKTWGSGCGTIVDINIDSITFNKSIF